MKIWFINHYAVPPQYYPLARPSKMAKNLIKMGHDVTIIAASTVHNSESKNLIESKEKVKHIVDDGIPYVLINCTPYQGNGVKRVVNILEFARKLPKVLDTLEKPDAIMATSFDPFTCYEGIKYAKKHGIKAVAEIADLWPETLVEYTGISKNNPIVKYLRNIEKKIYTKADEIVFTMEGAYDYIVDQRWEGIIPKDKVHYINNGVDLEEFNYNKEHFIIDDEDLNNPLLFKVVYTGSIRKVNNLGKLLDIAKEINNKNVKFLVWGDGDEFPYLNKRIASEGIENVVLKGKIEKKYIPYITSKADINFAHNESSELFRFGISFNKIFDYLAAGRPILCDFKANQNPVINLNAGFCVESCDIKETAYEIEKMSIMGHDYLDNYANNALEGSVKYDYKSLTHRLEKVFLNK